ncbi:hypothetical protein, partial [Blastococcus sp. CCUG 61487]|uniref:hypothetical protein n=1 Tax=Blastococcus sp. CCUG 61487 TaxID=1840703 RepID=UPI001BAFE8C7
MSTSEATLAGEIAARGSSTAGDSALIGLIGVLDRADGPPPRPRNRPVHSTAFRATGRPVPLRSVQPAPPARAGRVPSAPAPRVVVVPERQRVPITGLRDLVRRLALWGGGADGEYLAWRTAAPAPRPSQRTRVRALVRRAALWGAGEHGEYLAWGAPVAARRRLDPPIVLHELPSTPTIRPAAPSPAAAPRPTPVARRGPRSPVGPVHSPPPPGWPQPPAWAVPGAARIAARPRPAHLGA